MLLIKNAKIIHPGSKLNGKKRDLLIKEGRIDSIKAKITAPQAKVVNASGAFISIGWLDHGVQTSDPGFEHREDLASIAKSAAAGGFTGLACQPNTSPTIHSKSEVLYLKNNTRESIVDFYALGAISQNCEGVDITEMYDMNQAGAIAFSDGKKALQNGGLMMRALQYVKAFNGIVINHPHDYGIIKDGQMHEGKVSTSLGMKGFPAIAEELMLQRDIYLLEYTESRLHAANVSTANAVRQLKEAKAKGLDITCSTPIFNLIFEDNEVLNFDTNFKVLPPLREKKDIKALHSGLKNGTIDLISSNHIPLEQEAKDLEFPYAKFGAIGLETLYPLYNTHLSKIISTEDFVQKVAFNSRTAFDLSIPEIAEGALANLTIFHPKSEWTYTKKDIQSKSKNSPLIGHSFQGKVIGVINKGKHYFNH